MRLYVPQPLLFDHCFCEGESGRIATMGPQLQVLKNKGWKKQGACQIGKWIQTT
jgi:hypothetical protein